MSGVRNIGLLFDSTTVSLHSSLEQLQLYRGKQNLEDLKITIVGIR